jgi:hypothetical protein
MFPAGTETPVGFRTVTIRRTREAGEAVIYRDGARIPNAQVAADEASFGVKHVVAGTAINYFDNQSSEAVGSQLAMKTLRAARNAITRKINLLAWHGDAAHNLPGITNYPYLDKAVAGVTFDGNATPDEVIAELNRWSHYATNKSKQVFSPDTLVTSPRIRSYLFSTPRSSTSDKSIGQWWLENNGRITKILEAWECQASGPGGTDYMFFYRNDPEAVSIELVGGFQQLPVQRDQFVDLVIMFMSYAGVNMIDVGNNVLVMAIGPTV